MHIRVMYHHEHIVYAGNLSKLLSIGILLL